MMRFRPMLRAHRRMPYEPVEAHHETGSLEISGARSCRTGDATQAVPVLPRCTEPAGGSKTGIQLRALRILRAALPPSDGIAGGDGSILPGGLQSARVDDGFAQRHGAQALPGHEFPRDTEGLFARHRPAGSPRDWPRATGPGLRSELGLLHVTASQGGI